MTAIPELPIICPLPPPRLPPYLPYPCCRSSSAESLFPRPAAVGTHAQCSCCSKLPYSQSNKAAWCTVISCSCRSRILQRLALLLQVRGVRHLPWGRCGHKWHTQDYCLVMAAPATCSMWTSTRSTLGTGQWSLSNPGR